jgi:uroporphyrinogen III methyltransferase/synthase
VLDQFQRSGGRLASIGPITSDTLRSFGLKADAEANPHTIEGLVEAITSKEGKRS